jgi:acyl carrier protein
MPYDPAQDDTRAVVLETLALVSPGLPSDDSLPLIGSQASLDSVGFINLLVALEQRLGGAIDLSASFMEQGDGEGPGNPFRTVGSLTRHIQDLRNTNGPR